MNDRRCVELTEWDSKSVRGITLSPEDSRIAEQLADGKRSRLKVEEMRNEIRITTTSWIGVVQLDSLEIRVVPKLAGENVGLVRLIDFTTGLRSLHRLSGSATIDTDDINLVDLLALLLAEAAERVAGRGLVADYVEREEDLPALRGRLLPDRQVLERFGMVDRVICRFDEHEHNILENRLLAAALSVCLRRVNDPKVKRQVHRQFGIYRAVADPAGLNLYAARRGIHYHRINEHYREAHQLAWLILDGLGVEDLLTPGSTRSFAFMLDMNRIFERFVENAVRWVLRGAQVDVDAQYARDSILWNVDRQSRYARVIPDLLVTTKDGPISRLVIDAKYKLYDERKLSSSDLYQMFLYAYAFGRNDSDVLPRSLLVYPASTGTAGAHIEVRRHGRASAEIRAEGLSIPQALDEIDANRIGPALGSLKGSIMKSFIANAVL